VTLSEELNRINSIFIDTAPIIYYIEAHPQFGPLAKEVVSAFQSGNLNVYSSVITLAEVLPKPIERGDEKLARKFAEFLKHGRNLTMIEISEGAAEAAGRLTPLLHKDVVESTACPHQKAVSTFLPPAQAPPQLPARREGLLPRREGLMARREDNFQRSLLD